MISLEYKIVEAFYLAREDFAEAGDFYSCKAIDLAADIAESFGSIGLAADDYFNVLINALQYDIENTEHDEGRAGFVRALELVSEIHRLA